MRFTAVQLLLSCCSWVMFSFYFHHRRNLPSFRSEPSVIKTSHCEMSEETIDDEWWERWGKSCVSGGLNESVLFQVFCLTFGVVRYDTLRKCKNFYVKCWPYQISVIIYWMSRPLNLSQCSSQRVEIRSSTEELFFCKHRQQEAQGKPTGTTNMLKMLVFCHITI